MERIRPNVACRLFVGQCCQQTVAQFARRLVGERDGDDLPRARGIDRTQLFGAGAVFRLGSGLVFGEEEQVLLGRTLGSKFARQPLAKAQDVDDTVDEHSGLAAACARKDEQRAFGGEHRFALAVV